ncbi:hypothetical protein BJ878DRAFT_237864 [Calycina marina]|uniref:Uncharacterized protein n=1 Tax=Calycina marina TaxID=1763456 RepID=A0A9P7ZCL0_9HELO|nr:hypothetical protein BJ878DRAFT_237864 [Calycina marina]
MLLGATCTSASMFPDRVGRDVLGGVVDADFYASPIWSDIIQRFADVMDNLKANPVTRIDKSLEVPVTLNHANTK